MEKLIDITTYPVSNVLSKLLEDKATKQNIIWATDTYSEFGEEFTDKMQMNSNSLLWCPDVIRPRIQKTQEEQEQRTRKNAEVFIPISIWREIPPCLQWYGVVGAFELRMTSHYHRSCYAFQSDPFAPRYPSRVASQAFGGCLSAFNKAVH